MKKEDLFEAFPQRRISPVDGMAVTAAVWEEAHRYHRKHQQLHAMMNHGPGIVTGLEVIGSDPPDSSLYVLPGIAVDSLGQTIVLPEPMAYDLGTSQGLLFLLLTHEESRPAAEGDREDAPKYAYAHFGIEAVSTLPDTAYVELARIRRQSREAPIVDAKDAEHPAANEIDQRFRRTVGALTQPVLSVAVCYVGGHQDRRHGRGASYLARALRCSGMQVWVEDGAPLVNGLQDYTVVYLVGQAAFELSRDEMNALYEFLQAGGTVLIESCRQGVAEGAPPADTAFADLLASMGAQVKELPPGHPLLLEPFLFAAPPPGFETEEGAQILVSDGVVYTTFDYGCLWQGERRDRTATREEIRTAMEWGRNIMKYAADRRASGSSGSDGA